MQQLFKGVSAIQQPAQGPQLRIVRESLERQVEQTSGRTRLSPRVQQPDVEHGPGRTLGVGPGRVGAERQRAPVLTGLHVAAHDPQFGVDGMADRGSPFEAG